MDISLLGQLNDKASKIRDFLNYYEDSDGLVDERCSINKGYSFDDIVDTSPELIKCINIAKKVAGNDCSVLIYGDTGTGKEMFAQSIYLESKVKNNQFVAINCAVIPGILFGTVKGAYTGSVDKRGLL